MRVAKILIVCMLGSESCSAKSLWNLVPWGLLSQTKKEVMGRDQKEPWRFSALDQTVDVAATSAVSLVPTSRQLQSMQSHWTLKWSRRPSKKLSNHVSSSQKRMGNKNDWNHQLLIQFVILVNVGVAIWCDRFWRFLRQPTTSTSSSKWCSWKWMPRVRNRWNNWRCVHPKRKSFLEFGGLAKFGVQTNSFSEVWVAEFFAWNLKPSLAEIPTPGGRSTTWAPQRRHHQRSAWCRPCFLRHKKPVFSWFQVLPNVN